jgi:Flp pilus assembly protein CpaB
MNMKSPKRSPIAAIVLAVIIGLLVIALLNGVIRPTQVVVAKVAIAPGTILSTDLVELRTIPMGARPADAVATIPEVVGKMVAVGRTPGDYIVTSILGEIAGAGIPSELPEGHVAMAIHVDLASGVAGLLRAGQTVAIIGMLSPDILHSTGLEEVTVPAQNWLATPVDPLIPQPSPTPAPTATPQPPSSPLARLAITGLKVLMVPQSFRYEELPTGSSEEELYSSARTSASATEGSVIVLDVPTTLFEVTPGFKVDPATLLAALDQYGVIHLALEPAQGLDVDVSDVVTLNLGELYQEMNEYRKK